MTIRGENTRERLLTEAARLIRQKGIGATSVNDLLTATGVRKGSLYFHFRSKDDLVTVVLERAGREFMKFLESRLDGPSPGAALENFFTGVLEIHRREGFFGGCIFGNTALETSDADSPCRALVETVFDAWTDRIRRVIKAAQASGETRRDLPPAELALQTVSMLEGGIMLARLKKDQQPLVLAIQALRELLVLRVCQRTGEKAGPEGPREEPQ